MLDAFPFEKWSEDITTFWTFGNEGSTGTWFMTIIGMIITAASLVGYVLLEKKKLEEQAAKLRAAMGAGQPQAGTEE
jgi:hypothetical protein